MKYSEINRAFTEAVGEYLRKGYTVNTATMGGTQGEVANIDLTDGRDVIRVVLEKDMDRSLFFQHTLVLKVGRAGGVRPHESRYSTVWNGRLEELSRKTWYVLGENRKTWEQVYGTREEAVKVRELQDVRRDRADRDEEPKIFTDDARVRVARRFLQRRLGRKRIDTKKIRLTRDSKGYLVRYGQKVFRLH